MGESFHFGEPGRSITKSQEPGRKGGGARGGRKLIEIQTIRLRLPNSSRIHTVITLAKASKRPPGRCDCVQVKKKPGAFATWPGRFQGNISGLLAPQGDTKKQKKTHASHTHPATTLQQQEVLVMSQPSSADKAPSTGKITGETNS